MAKIIDGTEVGDVAAFKVGRTTWVALVTKVTTDGYEGRVLAKGKDKFLPKRDQHKVTWTEAQVREAWTDA